MHRDVCKLRAVLLLLAGVLLIPAAARGQIQLSRHGWRVLADGEKEVITIGRQKLGSVVTDAGLAVNRNGESATLSDWSVDIVSGKLTVSTGAPMETKWEIGIGEEGVDVDCGADGASFVGNAPTSGDRVTARVESQDNDVMYAALGSVSARNIYNLFDRPTNMMIQFAEGSDLSREPGQRGTLDVTIPVGDGVELSVIEHYFTKHMGLQHYKPMPERYEHSSVGWDSWYAYYMGTTQEDMVRETNAIAEKLKPYGMEYVQLDACFTRGKEANWLEWNEEAWPKGGKYVFEHIREKGLKPGLWINIYGANHANPAMGDQFPDGKYPEDFYLRDKNGKLSGACCTADGTVVRLDFTNPDVIKKHLKPLFRTLKNEWGLAYLKDAGWGTWMDYYDKNRKRAHDSSVGSREGYTRAQRAIRKVLGDDTYILGCAMHELGLGFGVFDGSRTGGDDFASWGGMKVYFNSLFGQQWINGITWWSHPDATMIREPLTMDEARTIVSTISLSGQTYMTSDFYAEFSSKRRKRVQKSSNFGKKHPDLVKALPEERLELYRMTMPSRPIRAVDLYPFKQDRPRCCPEPKSYPKALDLKVNAEAGAYDVVAVYNWADQPEKKTVTFADDLGLDADGDYLVFDFWKQKLLGPRTGKVRVEVPRHGVRVLVIKPVRDRPQLLATSRHITGTFSIQALEWKQDNLIMSGRSTTVPGDPYTLFIRVPEGMQVVGLNTNTKDMSTQTAEGVFQLTMPGQEEPVEWLVKFVQR